MTVRQRRALFAVLAVAAAARLAWALYATEEPRFPLAGGGDAFSYYVSGRELAAGDGYVSFAIRVSDGIAVPTAYFPIGYPAMLGGLFWIVGHTPIPDNFPLAGSLLNVVLGTLSVGLVFVIAGQIFDTRVGLIAAALTAAFPNLVYYTATLQLETAFIFLALATVAVLVTHDWSTGPPSRARLVAFGVILGLSAEVRPFSLPFLAGLAVALLVTRAGPRNTLTALGWVALTLAVVFTPWTVRNIVRMDSPIVFSTNMGDTLCQDRSLDANGTFRFAAHCLEGYENVPLEDLEVERNSENTRRALDFVREHPGKELEQILERGFYMMRDDHDGVIAVEAGGNDPFLGHRLRTILTRTADWYFYAILVVSAFGLPALFRGRRPERLLVAISMLSLLAVPLGLWGNPRFHLPALPLVTIAAAVPLDSVLRRMPGARRPQQSSSRASAGSGGIRKRVLRGASITFSRKRPTVRRSL
jgi:Dolichyl-phosphate-mannose-protein mannosyltransferase